MIIITVISVIAIILQIRRVKVMITINDANKTYDNRKKISNNIIYKHAIEARFTEEVPP